MEKMVLDGSFQRLLARKRPRLWQSALVEPIIHFSFDNLDARTP